MYRLFALVAAIFVLLGSAISSVVAQESASDAAATDLAGVRPHPLTGERLASFET